MIELDRLIYQAISFELGDYTLLPNVGTKWLFVIISLIRLKAYPNHIHRTLFMIFDGVLDKDKRVFKTEVNHTGTTLIYM